MTGKGGAAKITSKEEVTGLHNPISWYKSETGFYPSNVQVWWAMKRPPQVTPDSLSKTYLEVFDPVMKDQITFGNTLAPKGHYILDAFVLDRGTAAGITGIPSYSSNGVRPKTCAFWAGRAWFAGTNNAEWNAKIYFSQIIERDGQVGLCYQQQDPTNEDLNELTPDAGGFILIPDMGAVIKMYQYADSMFVFADNGVWQISGSSGAGFKANDYAVTRLATVPSFGARSFVETDAGLLWWSRSSIWGLMAGQGGGYQIQSLTDGTIKDFLDAIPDDSKKYVKGAFNKQNKIVQWLYREVAPTTVEEQQQHDKILCLDTRTGAFFPWNPIQGTSVDTIWIAGIIAVQGDATVSTSEDVYAGLNQVFITDDSEQVAVVSDTITHEAVESRFKYLVFEEVQ
jgi:hypothetical protein